jgi:hypothetical protein
MLLNHGPSPRSSLGVPATVLLPVNVRGAELSARALLWVGTLLILLQNTHPRQEALEQLLKEDDVRKSAVKQREEEFWDSVPPSPCPFSALFFLSCCSFQSLTPY